MANRDSRENVALFPASFDPITNGHLDLVERALGVFDRLVIAVAFNTEKSGTFSKDERVAMLRFHIRLSDAWMYHNTVPGWWAEV